MKNLLLCIFCWFLLISIQVQGQTNTVDYLNIKTGNGKGIRFWNNNTGRYSISMGNSAEYKYGPVQDYSIKTTMYRSPTILNRGWTWGEQGQTPVAALRTDGTLQLASDITSHGNVYAQKFESYNPNVATSSSEYQVRILGTQPFSNSPSSWFYVSTEGKVGIGAFEGEESFNQDPYNFRSNNLKVRGSMAAFYRSSVSGHLDYVTIRANSHAIVTNASAHALVIKKDGGGDYQNLAIAKLFAKEVEVTSGLYQFPDYVFDSDYDLMSLNDLKEYIDDNNHLPEVPSAQDIKDDGSVKLGEMNLILLKKIEELTLYIIELKQQNDLIQKRLSKLEQ